MIYKIWLQKFVLFSILITVIVASINYIIDPYGIYDTDLFKFKPAEQHKIRMVKAIETKNIKPTSIILGNSRAGYGFAPSHSYFLQPAYNAAVTGGSFYEYLQYYKNALKQGNLKQVLLVTDYLHARAGRNKSDEFKSYFNDNYLSYKLLFNIDTLKDSLSTVMTKNKGYITSKDGQLVNDNYTWKNILATGGHLATMNRDEKVYYKGLSTPVLNNGILQDAFDDFREIIELSYKNNIKLEIIFGPMHIRQHEAFAYYAGYNTWLQYKKDIVKTVDKIAKEYHKKPFRVIDFAIYNELTAEEVPTDKNVQMKYHWEGAHYKNELGLIVLDRLSGIKTDFENFGVELNIDNINNHLEKLKDDRHKFIDVKKYQLEVFGKTNNL